MHHPSAPSTPVSAPSGRPASVTAARRGWRALALAAGLLASGAAQAIDFGPFSLTGYAKVEVQSNSNLCELCQKEPTEGKQKFWADELVFGRKYGSGTTDSIQFQPYLGFKYPLPAGWTLRGLLSQRWRDGKPDYPGGAVFERNVSVAHEEYGTLMIGATTSRTWAFTDFPFTNDFGISDAWPSAGAGYGLLGHAIRYTSRRFDVLDGDLTLEATYDTGPGGWQRNKPRLLELWGLYTRGGLMISANYQRSRNGEPVAFSKAAFYGLTPNPARDDAVLGGSDQSVLIVNARYYVTPQWEVAGGVRLNRWSGAYGVVLVPARGRDLWNNMFNVDWFGFDDNGVPYPGYPVRTNDLMLAARYLTGPWTASASVVHLGTGRTDNPLERGQSNSALIGTAQLSYDFRNGLKVSAFAGAVQYGRKGLAPFSMPANDAFTNVDSRISKRGNWVGASATYTF